MCGHVAGGLVGRRRAPMAALFYLFQTRFIPDQWSRRYSAGSESTVARIEPRPRHIILCLLEPENYLWWVLWIMDMHMTSHIQNKLNKKKLIRPRRFLPAARTGWTYSTLPRTTRARHQKEGFFVFVSGAVA